MKKVFAQINSRSGLLSSLVLILALATITQAQHEGHKPPQPRPKPAKPSPLATPSPTPSPIPMPAATEQATPQPSPTELHKHIPAATPSPTEVHKHAPGEPSPTPHIESPDHEAMKTSAATGHAGSGLLVMTEKEMGIRVGSSANFLSMGQMGSGTAWNPASAPLHMHHKQSGDWLLMFHYNTIVGVNSQGGPRGVTKLESQNWFMPMAFHKLGPGTLQLRGMFSFEPFTFPPGGSPLLFQTGETYRGQPIIDAQHPHDLFMELSATYTVPLGERGTWFAYFGYPGEPALGPTAFMHRASASENPAAVLSHHYQDSSHITFGVVTTGFTYRWFKVEGSIFNGREPDENRYGFEAHPWTSRSARLSFAPNNNWSMQISHGFLREPEALEPGDLRRTTASISYNKLFNRGNWATSLIWGRNHENHGGEIFNLNGYLAESTVNFLDRNISTRVWSWLTRISCCALQIEPSWESPITIRLSELEPTLLVRFAMFGTRTKSCWDWAAMCRSIRSRQRLMQSMVSIPRRFVCFCVSGLSR